MKWKYFWGWLGAIPLAILNGAMREFWFRQFLSELPAHQLSAASFILLFGAYVWLLDRWLKIPSSGEALRVGFLWLGLTIVFEFLFGHYVMGHPWEILLRDYNLAAGRLWVLVLLWITFAPLAVHRLRQTRTGPAA